MMKFNTHNARDDDNEDPPEFDQRADDFDLTEPVDSTWDVSVGSSRR